jgi:hypothetical protein
MLPVGLEPTIPGSERAKTGHALDRAATVIGNFTFYLVIKYNNVRRNETRKLENCLWMPLPPSPIICGSSDGETTDTFPCVDQHKLQAADNTSN